MRFTADAPGRRAWPVVAACAACAAALVAVATLAEAAPTADPARPDPGVIARAQAAAASTARMLLVGRRLALPVAGVEASALRDTFAEGRPGHPHEAIDIAAPRGTPVYAVEDGTVARLFHSVPGGLTVYHFDPARQLAYYYAHLDRYADGLREGAAIHRCDLIGYVGSTGNALRGAPHLHFAVFELGPERRWWQGTALNPYAALRAGSTCR